MSSPLQITVGIELECIVRFDPDNYEAGLAPGEGTLFPAGVTRQEKLSILVRHHMALVIANAGYQCHTQPEEKSAQKWSVGEDDTVQYRRDGRHYTDIEIRSPALYLKPDGLMQIQAVVDLLRSEFELSVNDTCALHVHVGNERRGYPLQTLKNLCILTSMFEGRLSALHHPSRVLVGSLGQEYCRTPSSVFSGKSPWDIALMVQAFGTQEELVKRYSGSGLVTDKCQAYSLCSLRPESHRTIEFRQHESTLDTEEIRHWICVVAGLVSAAHKMGIQTLIKMCSEHASEGGFDVFCMLKALGMGELREHYQARGIYEHPAPFLANVDQPAEEGQELSDEEDLAAGVRFLKI